MSMYAPFPESVLREIRLIFGNHKCCDCSSHDTDWANINHGTLICLDCAGKHRSLGVHVSFIRSLYMDTWNENQIAMIRYGGNGQIRDFFKKLKIENSTINVLYMTKGASLYRERLKARVDKLLAGEVVVESPKMIPSSHSMEQITHSTPTRPEKMFTYESIFEKGPMGITLTKDFRGEASVSKIVPGGAGARKGVQLNDIVVGIMGKAIDDYDEIMHMILCMERPIRLSFRRVIKPPSPRTAESFGHQHFSTSNLSSRNDHDQITSNNHPTFPKPSTSVKVSNSHSKHAAIAMIHNEDSSDSDVDVQIKPTVLDSRLKKRRNSKNILVPPTDPSPRCSVISDTNNVESYDAIQALSDNNDVADVSATTSLDHNDHIQPKMSLETPTRETMFVDLETPRPENIDDVIHAINLAVGSMDLTVDDDHNHHIDDDVLSVIEDGQQLEIQSQPHTTNDSSDTPATADDYELVEHSTAQDIEVVEFEAAAVDISFDSVISDAVKINETESNEDDSEDEGDDDEPLSTYIQPGMEVKVFRKNKWRTAVIKKQHKDGGFKVTYRKDGLSESHVTVERIGLTPKTLQLIEVAMLAKRSMRTDDDINSYSTKSEPSYHASYSYSDLTKSSIQSTIHSHRSRGLNESLQDTAEFIVSQSESLDDWIEEDTSASLHHMQYDADKRKQQQGSQLQPVIDANKQYLARFMNPPLGLTLARGHDGSAEVTKIKADGQATSLGVMIGDLVVAVEGVTVHGYHDAMTMLGRAAYPLTLVFERGSVHSMLHRTGSVMMKGSKIIRDELGLAKKSILDAPVNERLANRSRDKSKDGAVSKDEKPSRASMQTKRGLPAEPANANEYDITFTEGDLGLRLEEKFLSASAVSMVVSVAPNSQAHMKGVHLNSYVIGVNGEYFISHAHTIACVKHTRPVRVRFSRR